MPDFITTEVLYQHFLSAAGVSTDTRQLEAGQLFFALKGPNFNGNRYAAQALEKDAAFVVVDEVSAATDEKCLMVPDGLNALQALAHHHRQQLTCPVIGITGSNGKTTTKELLTLCLQERFDTYATPGNFNNHIGLPLTLLGVPASAEMVIVEMGDNQLGDIAELCTIGEPTHGLITNIGKDHIGGYGSFEGNIRAKSELFDYLLKHKGQIFVNREDPLLQNMARRFKDPSALFYGGEEDGIQLESASPFIAFGSSLGTVKTQTLGAYNLINMQTVRSVALHFGVSEEAINRALASYSPKNNRSQWVEKGTNRIILDAYNANPSSVELAIKNLADFDTEQPKVCILGDMEELGDISAEEHLKMIGLALNAHFQQCVFIGEKFAEHRTDKGLFFAARTGFEKYLEENPLHERLILLKASRKIQLEKLVENLG